ncbi:DUF6920 family protein [Cyclobacterium jeungdonense]|uniref:Uncharacterized protein n=1 Tax=Cyclobacterium jeungdonense TaxID=708087 RepID=A0ABT8C3K4_9BACT|nr:DUF6544 family protein [Cyclobacterium jeungdonense]MDN3687355.1 hypothetical protein [Cyclobacterium jeungdonense]
MKITIIILMAFHGFIHFLGFLKAYEWMELKELPLQISKDTGMLWLLAGIGILVVTIGYAWQVNYWWYLGMALAIFSQVLIILYWGEAKFGTLPNLVLFFLSLVAGANASFEKQVHKEVTGLFSQSPESFGKTDSQSVSSYPAPVQRWLERTGALDAPLPGQVLVKQDFQLKLKPNQGDWYQGTARQYFNPVNPGFVWSLDLKLNPLIQVKGRDKLKDGEGEMLIKIWSLISMVDEKDNPRINEGTLQRFLGEIVWFPAAAKSPYLIWEALNNNEAKAILTVQGTSVSGVFTFDEIGRFEKFRTERYMGGEADATRKPWIVEAREYSRFEGVEVPSLCEASWILEEGPWTWAKIRILSIENKSRPTL